ncbi:hypothetical protein [Pseudoalteromonas sp. DY56-GL79]|uniref:hypothetical protein n=1 Tax=Pseudoalteromonas sp. DY56-GL79 TaxID=2967131 RepID=UPI00352B3A62
MNSIEDSQVKDYMKEAMSCYMAGAYRACIVLTYIALFDDIVKKLGELGKVNKKAKKIHDEAQNKINAQDVYESYVIDQLKSNALLPALDATFLDTLRVLRNKSSHPSGHHASAEEARFIVFEAISRFLSKPILTTTQLVDEILSRLDEKHFFTSTDISKISGVVRKELKNIHHETFPYLINKFLDKTLSSNVDIACNAGFFLTGLSYLKEELTATYVKKYVIESKCSNSNYSLLILRLISANGALLQGLDPITFDRLRSVISERIGSVESSLEHTRFSHPSSVLKSIMEGCGEDMLIDNFKDQLTEFFRKNILSKYFIAHMAEYSKVVEVYFEEVCKKAGSSDYNTANDLSRNIHDADAYLSKSLTDEQAFILISNILQAAEWGAWGAQSLRDSKFSSVPEMKAIAINYIDANKATAKVKFANIYNDGDKFDALINKYLKDEEETA